MTCWLQFLILLYGFLNTNNDNLGYMKRNFSLRNIEHGISCYEQLYSFIIIKF